MSFRLPLRLVERPGPCTGSDYLVRVGELGEFRVVSGPLDSDPPAVRQDAEGAEHVGALVDDIGPTRVCPRH